MKTIFLVVSIFSLFSFAECKKQHTPKTELEKLPPATQTGANTFGCLINGVAFTPGGGGILDNTFSVTYDATFEGGQFIIKTKNLNSNIYINLHADSISAPGIYELGLKTKYWINYNSNNYSCTYSNYYENPISGSLAISKFDISSRIVSGTFSFKFMNTNCGTIEATDGRFDVKY